MNSVDVTASIDDIDGEPIVIEMKISTNYELFSSLCEISRQKVSEATILAATIVESRNMMLSQSLTCHGSWREYYETGP